MSYTINIGGTDYTVDTYTSTGAFTWTPPAGVTTYDVLIVAGGGGGAAQGNGGGAGGAGGLLWLTGQSCTPGVGISGTVGTGGAGGAAGGTNPGGNGGSSSLGATSTTGGGGGGAGSSGTTANNGKAGGSGGGGSGATLAGGSSGGTGVSGQGNAGAGGSLSNTASDRAGGGGGGKGSAGSAGVFNLGGAGGTGYDATATLGTSVGEGGWFASGGGAGSNNPASGTVGTASAGGGGGGGRPSAGATSGEAAQANTGGGGGGGGGNNGATNGAGGNGGTGFVAIRYVAPSVGEFSLSAARPARTAAFSVATTLAGTLSATRPQRTAAFTAATVLTASLSATTPARVSEFAIDVAPEFRTVTLSAERPPRSASFALAGVADMALGAERPLRTAALTLAVDAEAAPLVLSAERPQRTAAFTVWTGAAGNPGLTSFAGIRPQREATFVARATIPITPVPAHLQIQGPAPVVIGRALGPVTAMAGPHGTQPVYAVSSAAIQRARQQIVADGVDITFLRGVRTPDVTYTLLAPLRYGPGELRLPQVVGGMEPLDPDAEDRNPDLSWMWPGAPVEVNLVLDDPAGIDPPQLVMEGVYKGVLVAWDLDGVNVSLELGGEANGRASLRDRQAVIFPRVNDIGHQMSDAVKDLGLPVYPPLGTVTGIEVMTTGGVGHIEHIQNLCAQAWTRQGKYWTIMPNVDGAYEVRKKSDTVRHATVFFDDARVVAKLRRDIAAEPNRIFVTGVTPAGQRVRFGVYPGLVQGPTPDFPGHMEEGDTGEGVRLLVRKLQQSGYLKLADVVGGYDDDVVEAVKDLQDDAGLPKTGEVNQQTWNALYDLNVTGLTLVGAHIEPAAQDPRVRRVNRSANGTVLEFNDDYDPRVLPVDRTIDAGVGKTRSQLREFARTVLEAASTPNWVGDITFHTGALLDGEQPADVTVTSEMVRDARTLIPTENLWAPRFEGGTQFNISALRHGDDGIVTATVDTRFRDALEVWDIIDRNRESRNDPARRRNMAARSSTIRKDSLGEWDEIGGLLGVDIRLERGWNIFEMPGVAAEGQIRRIRIELTTAAEFAYAVFGRKPERSWLNSNIPHPLTVSGTKAWDTHNDELVSDYWMLFSRGTHAEPAGYWPGRKVYKSVTGREANPDYDPETDPESEEYIEVTTTEVSGTITGKDVDAAGFPYFSETRTSLWVAVWSGKSNVIEAGRIMWPQLEAGT